MPDHLPSAICESEMKFSAWMNKSTIKELSLRKKTPRMTFVRISGKLLRFGFCIAVENDFSLLRSGERV